MAYSEFVYRCRCGHLVEIKTDAADTPANRLKALADQGWGLDGLEVLCPCCVRHLQGEHALDAPITYASEDDVQRAALLTSRLTYERLLLADMERRGSAAVTNQKAVVGLIQQDYDAVRERVEAEQIRRTKLARCRRCHPDPNDTLLQRGTA